MAGHRSIARVIVDLALDREFDYRIPASLAGEIVIGSRVVVPFGRGTQNGFVIGLADASNHPGLKEIQGTVGQGSYLADDVLQLARWISNYYVCPFESTIRTVLPAPVRKNNNAFKKEKTLTLTLIGRGMLEAPDDKKTARQRAALQWLAENGPASQREIIRSCPTTVAILKTLAEKGAIEAGTATRMRDPFKDHEVMRTQPLTLMPQQQQALDACRAAMDAVAPGVILLNGVTGSGKTEVYLQAIDYAVKSDRGAIVLVPEIALTPQTVDRFRGRFGEVVAVLHSDLSDGERHDEWHRIRTGAARIVVGARSALFAPVPKLGLIVVDEEHESSYKQDEAPRYHARDMAVVRGQISRCAVVLGSATPSLESVLNVRKGKYTEVLMPHRIDHRTMPHMRIVDLCAGLEPGAKPHVVSDDLVQAIRNRLDRAEQTMLFLNRRGFSSQLLCPKCGEAPKCDHCSVTLTYHKTAKKLMCHFCATEYPVPDRCPNPSCRDPNFKYAGIGTQRIEEVVQKIFPKARVFRMDSDTMTRRDSYRTVLNDFRAGKIDILIGTQMIAKGLDFPNVTLVGVVDADTMLRQPDMRAAERTFQLIAQVAGRTGRGERSGRVLVQTTCPDDPAVRFAAKHDYIGFAGHELAERRDTQAPPFSCAARVIFRGLDERRTREAAIAVADRLRAACSGELQSVRVLGAAPAPIVRLRNFWRFHLQICAATVEQVRGVWQAVERTLELPEDVEAAVDVDPINSR